MLRQEHTLMTQSNQNRCTAPGQSKSRMDIEQLYPSTHTQGTPAKSTNGPAVCPRFFQLLPRRQLLSKRISSLSNQSYIPHRHLTPNAGIQHGTAIAQQTARPHVPCCLSTHLHPLLLPGAFKPGTTKPPGSGPVAPSYCHPPTHPTFHQSGHARPD